MQRVPDYTYIGKDDSFVAEVYKDEGVEMRWNHPDSPQNDEVSFTIQQSFLRAVARAYFEEYRKRKNDGSLKETFLKYSEIISDKRNHVYWYIMNEGRKPEVKKVDGNFEVYLDDVCVSRIIDDKIYSITHSEEGVKTIVLNYVMTSWDVRKHFVDEVVQLCFHLFRDEKDKIGILESLILTRCDYLKTKAEELTRQARELNTEKIRIYSKYFPEKL